MILEKVNIIHALHKVNYRLLLAILFSMLLPSIYQTGRIYYLGELPSGSGFTIASQFSWLALIYEVVQEGLILPLFFILGKCLNDKAAFENRVRSGLVVSGLVYFLIFLIIIITVKPLVTFMKQEEHLLGLTIDYIRLEALAAVFSILWKFLFLTLIVAGKYKDIYRLLIAQTVVSALFDTLLISSFPFSVNMGVLGIPISNIFVSGFLFTYASRLLKRTGVNLFSNERLSGKWMLEWFSVGKYSALESLLRNCIFILMIIRMVNLISEQDNYWLANNFIWNWLLLPGLALADLVKKEIGESVDAIREKTFGYILLAILISIGWIATIPVWKTFLYHFMNIRDYEVVYNIVLIQTGFYLTFLFNNSICDSTFFAVGKTNYILLQSIIVNVFYYGLFYLFYLIGIFVPTVNSISIMFGTGMLIDCVPTGILYIRLLKERKIKINFR